MQDQTSNIKRAHKIFKGTKLEENNNTALCLHNVCIFQIINLTILKWLI